MKKVVQYMKAMAVCLLEAVTVAVLAFVPEANVEIANGFLKGFDKET